MARTKGSDTLYKLIHSLSTEEKGYFMKFAKRHTAVGNSYLKLFDAINQQPEFDEKLLKKKFPGYTSMKVYLREIIMDSLVLYYKKSHSHLQLFNEIEKIHVLLEKGFAAEAGKELEKALELSRRMEIFTLERYLLRLRRGRVVQKPNTTSPARPQKVVYQEVMDDNLKFELNMTAWELEVIDWHQQTVYSLGRNELIPEDEIKRISGMPTLTLGTQIDRLSVLMFMSQLNGDVASCYTYSKQHIQVVKKFKQNVDPGAKIFFALNNHVKNCLQLGYYDEGLQHIDEMIKSQPGNSAYADMARSRSYLAKLFVYFRSGRFEEGVRFVRSTEADMAQITKRMADETKMLSYRMLKAHLLLLTKNYRECWMALQEIKFKGKPGTKELYILWVEIALAVQLEMKNFDIVNSMGRRESKMFARLKIQVDLCDLITDFFKQVNAINYKNLAKEYFVTTLELCKSKSVDVDTAEAARIFAYWLDEISGGKTVKQHFVEFNQMQLNKKSPLV